MSSSVIATTRPAISSLGAISTRRASMSVVRTAEDVGHARVTSSDQVALQFYWQGYDAYAHCKLHESVAPCFFNAHCAGQSDDAEFVHIVPVEEVRDRSILDEMRVQVVSVSTGKYLRATRVSKFLRWSSARDEQTVFQIQVLDRKPLTQGSKFTLASSFWSGYSIGFGQKLPLGGGSRDLANAIGFLTLEKKKHQPPLLFPIRFRAVLREFRNLRPASSPSHQEAPTAFVTASDMVFIDEEHEERVANIPLATVVPANHSIIVPGAGGVETSAGPEDDVLGDACPYCSVHIRQRAGLLAHIRDYHGDWLTRPSVEGSFCVHCGQRRIGGVCSRSPISANHSTRFFAVIFCVKVHQVAETSKAKRKSSIVDLDSISSDCVVFSFSLASIHTHSIRAFADKSASTHTDEMTNKESETKAPAAAPVLGKSGKKICCSCPETKKERDLCVITNGEDLCKDIIEKHKACLRSEGFTVK